MGNTQDDDPVCVAACTDPRRSLKGCRVGDVHLKIGSLIRDRELNKTFLENRLDEQFQAISEQRAELR